MREMEGYRDQLESLTKFFGDVGMVTQAQVMAYTGRCNKWVKAHLGVGRQGITLPILARRLLAVCEEP